MRRTLTVGDSCALVAAGWYPRAQRRDSSANRSATVNDKVETLGQSLEATQQQTKENAARIEQVDQKAGQAGTAAQTAQKSATAARSAADAAAAKVAAVETAAKRLIFEVVLSDDQGNFELGKADLPDDVRAKLDELATKLKADPAGNYIEIEGHTDATGSTEPKTNGSAWRARKT